LSKKIDQATFDFYRAAELKHGRVSQLAVLGYIAPEIYHFPGDIAPGVSFASIPNGIQALTAVPALGWMQIFFLIGFIDYRLSLGKSAAPFAFSAGELIFKSSEDEVKAKSQELAHGRLAMLAILELLRHDSQDFVAGGDFNGIGTQLITGLPFLYGN
jgi:Chlorophyll A-B binding protein